MYVIRKKIKRGGSTVIWKWKGQEARAKVEKAQRKAEQNKKKIIGWTQRGFTVIDVHYHEMHITVRWPKGQAEEMISAMVAAMARCLMVNPSIYDDVMRALTQRLYSLRDSTLGSPVASEQAQQAG